MRVISVRGFSSYLLQVTSFVSPEATVMDCAGQEPMTTV